MYTMYANASKYYPFLHSHYHVHKMKSLGVVIGDEHHITWYEESIHGCLYVLVKTIYII